MSTEIVPLEEAHDVERRANTWGTGAVLLSSPPAIDDDTTLLEQLLNRARASGLDEPTDICDFAVDALTAEALLPRVPRPMSRGERQLCGILLALAAPAEALFLIDPTAGLDMARRHAVQGLLRDWSRLTPTAVVVVATDDPVLAGT